MLTLYLVRHGNTENNKKGIIMGQIDTPLTDEGLKDARALSRYLKKFKFDAIFSSDLGRAFITAYIISDTANMKSKLHRARELREINFGIYANYSKDLMKKKCPQYKKDMDFVFPQGESFNGMQKRVVSFVKRLEKKYPKKTLLLVTHAGALRAIKCHFNNWDLAEHMNLKVSHRFIAKLVINKGKLFSYEVIKP